MEVITHNFWTLVDFFKTYAVFLTVFVNLYATILIVNISWKGWAAKFVLDAYFAYTYLNLYLVDPSTNNLNLLINMCVFLLAHAWGFWKWKARG